MLSDLKDAPVHGKTIVPGSDDQVHPFYQAVLVNFVMMNQCSPRRFGNANSLKLIGLSKCPDAPVENVGFIEELFDPLDSIKNFDQSGVMPGRLSVSRNTR